MVTGLDYFDARYLSSAQGRFLSPDTVVLNPERTDPQLWNKYSYVGNSPLVKVDPNGKWPTWFHHQLDEEFFGKNVGLSALSVRDIEQGSDWVDSLGNQGGPQSFMHSMRDGIAEQSVESARIQAEDWVSAELGAAVQAQIQFELKGGKGYDAMALVHFAHGLHTVQDATSPEHSGYQPWYGLGHPFKAYDHSHREEQSSISQDVADALARHEAQVATARIWARFQTELARQRKKKRESDKGAKENDPNGNQ